MGGKDDVTRSQVVVSTVTVPLLKLTFPEIKLDIVSLEMAEIHLLSHVSSVYRIFTN